VYSNVRFLSGDRQTAEQHVPYHRTWIGGWKQNALASKIRPMNHVATRERMPCGQSDQHPFAPEGLASKPIVTGNTHEDRNIDLSGIETGEQSAPIGFHALHFNIRMSIAPAHHRRPKVPGGNGAVEVQSQMATATITPMMMKSFALLLGAGCSPGDDDW
jgi:hypothetical protein